MKNKKKKKKRKEKGKKKATGAGSFTFLLSGFTSPFCVRSNDTGGAGQCDTWPWR